MVIDCVGKLADVIVPVHVPAMFTTGPVGAGAEAVGGVGAVAPQPVEPPATTAE